MKKFLVIFVNSENSLDYKTDIIKGESLEEVKNRLSTIFDFYNIFELINIYDLEDLIKDGAIEFEKEPVNSMTYWNNAKKKDEFRFCPFRFDTNAGMRRCVGHTCMAYTVDPEDSSHYCARLRKENENENF